MKIYICTKNAWIAACLVLLPPKIHNKKNTYIYEIPVNIPMELHSTKNNYIKTLFYLHSTTPSQYSLSYLGMELAGILLSERCGQDQNREQECIRSVVNQMCELENGFDSMTTVIRAAEAKQFSETQ